MLDREKADALDDVLRQRKESRASWFRRIVDREISAPFTSKYGFSVVAPISVTVPSSTKGSR